jgi:hypothetical protein
LHGSALRHHITNFDFVNVVFFKMVWLLAHFFSGTCTMVMKVLALLIGSSMEALWGIISKLFDAVLLSGSSEKDECSLLELIVECEDGSGAAKVISIIVKSKHFCILIGLVKQTYVNFFCSIPSLVSFHSCYSSFYVTHTIILTTIGNNTITKG